MSASWPAGKKTFTQIVDGVTYMEAVNCNTVYDEVEAVQTFLGASGETQAKNAALTTLFKAMFQHNPAITWDDADTLTIEATQALMFDGADYVIKQNTETLEIKLSEDLDTGGEANSTMYDIFLVGDGSGSSYTACFVVSGNTPNGATYYKKIGEIYNNADGDMEANTLQPANVEAKFGEWEDRVKNTVYQAQIDGFIIAQRTGTGSYEILVDSNTPPTTRRQLSMFVSGDDGGMMIVHKGEYYKVTEATNVWFVAKGIL